MSIGRFNEDIVELAAIGWLQEINYAHYTETDWSTGDPRERASYNDVSLAERLQNALQRINPDIPAAALDNAYRQLTRHDSPSLLVNNQRFHRLLTEGVDVEYRQGGPIKYDKVWAIDFDNPANNDWVAVNQFTVTGVHARGRHKTHRRPDVVVFCNGLPLIVLELKNPADEKATLQTAYRQLQTYKDEIPDLFIYNAALVIADGVEARIGSLTANLEWFKPWRTIDGTTIEDVGGAQLEVLIKGALAPSRLLDLIRYFTVFEGDGDKLIKKMAGYHQYHAVNKAVERTVAASGPDGDQKVGVIWHTQGSGKSLSMLFFAGKIIQHPQMENPTLVILTDRNDLDDQLFDQFASGQALLRTEPKQADSRDHLGTLLQVAAGGVVFTTIQKFRPPDQASTYPTLSTRRNIIFIADEAHRSQYGFHARYVQTQDEREAYLAYGFAKYVRDALPNASFIGFTGTPIDKTDASTKEVFGDYIDVYDIQRAVDDGATVPIYYESRLAPLRILEKQRDLLDSEFENITETADETLREELRSKWTTLEAAVGATERLDKIAKDIVTHFEARLQVLDGKAMIVCMSRRICVELYDQIVALRPDWHSDLDSEGAIKVIMTGAAGDPEGYQPHIRNKSRRKALAERYKKPDDGLKLVIVRDMWLTGFDAPPMHTMYLDKPMRGHSLMQAIARVNRVFKDKPGGLIVDYLGIAVELREAVNEYTIEGYGKPASTQAEAVDVMLQYYEVVRDMLHDFDYSLFHLGTPAERVKVIPAAMNYILTLDNGQKRFLDNVTALSKAYALATPAPEALEIREDVAFFQAVRATFVKYTATDAPTRDDMDVAVKQLVSQAISSNEVINIFEAAGLKTPDVGILSDDFLDGVRHMERKNLAFELLRKLLNDEVKARSSKNVVKARSFSAMLEEAVKRYQNRSIDVAEVINELIDLAKEMRDANQKGDELGLSEQELAFYDALAANTSAVAVMGDQQLAFIALELLKKLKANVSIDWTVKHSARAKIRVLIKRILRQYGYPPDLEEAATDLVLEQAEALAAYWATHQPEEQA